MGLRRHLRASAQRTAEVWQRPKSKLCDLVAMRCDECCRAKGRKRRARPEHAAHQLLGGGSIDGTVHRVR